jgi:hypothetical protein
MLTFSFGLYLLHEPSLPISLLSGKSMSLFLLRRISEESFIRIGLLMAALGGRIIMLLSVYEKLF